MPKSIQERGPFGAFLYFQIKGNHRKSAQWLADELARLDSPIDASLIRHWMSGRRVPKEGHESILKIAKILCCSNAEVIEAQKSALAWLR